LCLKKKRKEKRKEKGEGEKKKRAEAILSCWVLIGIVLCGKKGERKKGGETEMTGA